MTPSEAATLLLISGTMVRRAIRHGRLRATRIGGGEIHARWDVPPEAIDEYRANVAIGHKAECPVCHASFLTTHGAEKYCSRTCKHRAATHIRMGRPLDTPKPEGRYYTKTATCDHCGQEYQRKKVDGKHCSPRCRQRAFFLRHGINPSEYAGGMHRVRKP